MFPVRSSLPRRSFAAFVQAVTLMLLGCLAANAADPGDDAIIDARAVEETNAVIAALLRYEAAPSADRGLALERLADAATRRAATMRVLAERRPRLALVRALPQEVRSRMPTAVRSVVESAVTVSGTVHAFVADDFERGRSETRLEIVDAAGRPVGLAIADASVREKLALAGRRVTVAGLRIGTQVVAETRSVQLLAAEGSSPTASTSLAAGGSPVQGEQTALVILLDFADRAIECSASDVQSRLFGAAGATTNAGYLQSSGGAVSFSGRAIGPFPTAFSSTGTCDHRAWAAAGDAAARAAGIEPSSYMRVSYATPRNANCGWLGLGALGGPLPTPSWTQQCTSTGLFSHEFGHNLNFQHAATPQSEYGDASDPMGANKLVQSNAPNRVMAGWASGSRVQDVTGGGSYSIAALDSASEGIQVLRLAKADTAETYFVSLRQPSGVDANLWPIYQNTLSIHRSTGAMPAYTVLVGTLASGQTFVDSANGIQITHQGVSGASAVVGIGAGGAACTRAAPTISVDPAGQVGAPGATLRYTVAVSNRNSAACPASTFNFTQSVPAGFAGQFATSAVSLAPGAGTSVGWDVSSGSTSADGTYTLTASASESSVTNAAQATSSYTVLAPVAPPPPPPAGDTTSPTVAITSPVDGAVIAGRQVDLRAVASDNIGVARVEFHVDGILVAADTSAPYATKWSTRKASRGPHAIRVRAVDVSGNAAEQTVWIVLP